MHPDYLKEIAETLHELKCLFKSDLEWRKSHSGLATKQDLVELSIKIMSAISEFAVKQNAFNDRIDSAFEGLTADVKALNDLIEKLQNTAGSVTPEDQALLNQIETRSDAVAAKLEALDAATPPTPPTA